MTGLWTWIFQAYLISYAALIGFTCVLFFTRGEGAFLLTGVKASGLFFSLFSLVIFMKIFYEQKKKKS